MAQLQDLCLTAIERTGADTHEVLGDLKDVLPPRMWTRHPILKITGSSLVDCDDDDVVCEEFIDLTVEYTGVYRLKTKHYYKTIEDEQDCLARESVEVYETLNAAMEERLRQLMHDTFCSISLMNPIGDKLIAKITEHNPYSENMEEVIPKIRTALESIPHYVHV